MEQKELRGRILEVIRSYPIGSIATIKDGNKPCVRYMVFRPEDDLTLYTTSFTSARKIAQIRDNSNVHIAFGADPENWVNPYVNFGGKAEILTDVETKTKYWDEMLSKFFTGPEDPNFVVIKVVPEIVEFWDSGAHEPMVFKQ